MHQAGINQPLKSVFIFTSSGSFLDNLVNELLVLSCQLRGNRFPDHRDLRELVDIGMLCKVTFIGSDDARQCFLHGSNIPSFSYLTDTFQVKGLRYGEFFQSSSLFIINRSIDTLFHTFIGGFVFFNHIFITCRNIKKTTLIT